MADTATRVVQLRKQPGGRGSRRGLQALQFVIKRLFSLLATLFVASLFVFFSRFLVPGDPARFLLRGRSPSPESIAAVTAEYGLDLPPWQQYLNWISGAVQGDFGKSLQYSQGVSEVLLARLPVTLELVAMAGLFTIILGVGAGAIASLKRGRFTDRAILMAATAFGATPAFVLAIILIAIFAVSLGWFPSFGSGEPGIDRLVHLVLPALSLGLALVALVARVTRSSMNEQMKREHVEVAVSRGLTTRTVVWRHVFRNALSPILLVTGVLIAGLIVTSSIVEQAFGLAGIGSLLVQSVERLDFGIVQAIVLLVVAAFVTVNTIVDLVQPLLDPRIAAGSETR